MASLSARSAQLSRPALKQIPRAVNVT